MNNNNNRTEKFNKKTLSTIDQQKQDKEKLIKPKIIISSIPSEPVRMHSTVKYSSQPIDIQFGDIQWTDSIPKITQSNEFNQQQTEFINNDNSQDSPSSSSSSSSNIVNETILTNQLSSSLSITDNTIVNCFFVVVFFFIKISIF